MKKEKGGFCNASTLFYLDIALTNCLNNETKLKQSKCFSLEIVFWSTLKLKKGVSFINSQN